MDPPSTRTWGSHGNFPADSISPSGDTPAAYHLYMYTLDKKTYKYCSGFHRCELMLKLKWNSQILNNTYSFRRPASPAQPGQAKQIIAHVNSAVLVLAC